MKVERVRVRQKDEGGNVDVESRRYVKEKREI